MEVVSSCCFFNKKQAEYEHKISLKENLFVNPAERLVMLLITNYFNLINIEIRIEIQFGNANISPIHSR